jgi:hypothetical protein
MSDANKIDVAVIHPDGSWAKLHIERNLETFQSLVGGWIEAVGGEGWTGYLDEDGKLKDDPQPNRKAERFMREHGWNGSPYDVIVGNVVFMGPPDVEGDDTSLPERFFAEIELL